MRSNCDPGEGGIGWVSSCLAIYQTLSSECPSYRGASSALLQLVNQWLNFVENDPLLFSYSADHLLSALLLRTLVVGRRQQSESIKVALGME